MSLRQRLTFSPLVLIFFPLICVVLVSLIASFPNSIELPGNQPLKKNKTHFHSLSLRTVGHLYIGRVLEPKHRLRSVYCGRRWFIMPLICRSYFDHHGSPSLLFSSSLLSPFGSPRFTFLRFNFENPWKSQQSFVDKSSSKELSAEDSDFVLDNNLYQESEIEVSKSFVPFLQSSDKSDPRKESCPDVSPKLVGWTNISIVRTSNTTQEGNDDAEEILREAGVEAGGRLEHLPIFIRHLHPFLQRQQLSYTIIVVEQSNGSSFNRGMLLNIGFTEALLQGKDPCFIFHDVDYLPEDDRHLYSCPEDGKPRQMAISIDYWDNYWPVPRYFFGGVSAISTHDFQQINGYSNLFWGWGGEDDQLYERILFNNLTVTRTFDDQPSLVHRARYKTLSHEKAEPNPDRMTILQEGSLRFETDGLSNLQYRRLDLQFKTLYTHILVDIQEKIYRLI